MQRCRSFMLAILFFTALNGYAATEEAIVFSTAPVHGKEETRKLYQPLMDYLSEETGRRFVIKPAANFVEYSVRMRLGRFDMLFDDAHMAGWRMVNKAHRPVVRLPGVVRFVVAADSQSALKSVQELNDGYSRVCAPPSPDFITRAFLSNFPTPEQMPGLVRAQGDKALLHCLKSTHGEAAVMHERLWQQMDETARSGLKLLAQPTRDYPERTITVGPRVDEALRQQIAEAMMNKKGIAASKKLLSAFGKNQFIPARQSEYDGLDQLLQSVWSFRRNEPL